MKSLSATSQYFGSCRKCGDKTAVIESFCFECRKTHKEEFNQELIAMGYKI